MDDVKAAGELAKVAKDLSASSEDIVAKGVKGAISSLQYLPTSAVSAEVEKRVKAVTRELLEILDSLPDPVTYRAYVDNDGIETGDVNELIRWMAKHGKRKKGLSGHGGHKWLWDQPTFEGMAGPIGDGPNVARYGTWEEFNRMTS